MGIFRIFILLIIVTNLKGQCPPKNSVIYASEQNQLSFDSIALYAAPIFWFSPDEPKLYNQLEQIQMPHNLPYADEKLETPVVYYKIKRIYSINQRIPINGSINDVDRSKALDLSDISALEIEYYLYYNEETGLGGHPHDIESVSLQIKVHENNQCIGSAYGLEVKRVIAKAHGLYWFENALNVDEQTTFPITILVEEGKHANCTDKNADGVYTPGFDVTEKVNDAWGVRDIISSGRLYTGGFQGWMAKVRTASSILLPPRYLGSSSFKTISGRFPRYHFENQYAIRSFPDFPETSSDKLLKKKVKEKQFKKWPVLKTSINPNKGFFKLSKDNKFRNKVGFSYRWDEGGGLSMSTPLLFVKHVEAPMTGGWFYHRFNFSDVRNPNRIGYQRILGHQIQHVNSASRWVDTYVGIGYEILDRDPLLETSELQTFLATELGMKVRVNITKTPLKFLKFLGTDYWGLKIGWKNVGFNPFFSNGLVIEFGAGAF